MNVSLSSGGVDVLVLAAFPPELVGMRRLLGEQLANSVSGLAVVCKTVGVGLPNATAGTVQRLLQLKPRAVVLIGTAGSYPACPASIGEAYVGKRLVLVDVAEVEQCGALPDPMPRVHEVNAMMALGLNAGRPPSAVVGNTLGVTTDDALAARIGATGCMLENMEAFGVANACALQGVPFACVFGISNRVGSEGRKEWQAHHRQASAAACEVVSRWLGGGAMGLPHTS